MFYDFTPGPASNHTGIVINAYGFGVEQNFSTLVPNPHRSFTLRIRFYDGAPDPLALPAVPSAEISNDFINYAVPGTIIYHSTPAVAITPITLPSDHGFVTLEVFELGTTILNAEVGPVVRGLTLPTVGSNNGVRYADASRNGRFEPAEALGSTVSPRGVLLILQGDIGSPAVPPAINLTPGGCIADAGLVYSSFLPDNIINWYKFTLCGAADFTSRHFFSIDSEGSGANIAAALYSAAGALAGDVPIDYDSGSGGNFQLTYGTGIGAAFGDGRQYDGRNGSLPAGEYYLAVGPNETVFIRDFDPRPNEGAGGQMTLNFRTNTNASPLAPSVEPALRAGQDLGRILAPGVVGTPFFLPRFEVDWTRFEICREVGSPDYFDIDMSRGDGTTDVMAGLFDQSGNLLFISDNTGSTNKPQFSFGDPGPRFYAHNANAFDGGTASILPVSTYWLAASLFPLTTTNDRWSVHNNSAASLAYNADFHTSYTECDGGCPPCAGDFNQDGGFTGDDVGAFFETFVTGEPCGDVNEDGGVTGEDVAFFFFLFESGHC